MPKFTYIGSDSAGKEVKQTVEADDRFAVYDIARKSGHVVSTIESGSSLKFNKLFDVKKLEYYMSRVKDDEVVMLTHNLSSMLNAGLPLSRALSVIERQSSNPRLKVVMQKVREDINKGAQFNEAIGKFPKVFNDLYVAMVRAGEESGGMADALKILGVQMERSSSLKKKIKGAMIYPSIVITILVIIGVLMMIYVMPSITGTFEKLDVDLPPTTKFLIATSKFFANHTLIAVGSMIAFVVSIVAFLRTTVGVRTSSWLVVRLPVIGKLAKEANSARTARTLSSLLSSGVDVIRSISITEDVLQNVFYKEILREAKVAVEKGNPLSEVFTEHTNLYPVLVGEMILVGEETGQISDMLQQLAVFYEDEVEQKTKDLSTIIEPILMVVIGGTVGFFALAVITPIYSISDSIG